MENEGLIEVFMKQAVELALDVAAVRVEVSDLGAGVDAL
jgi:hypothetical protein